MDKKKPKIKVETNYNSLRIFINGILHLSIKKNELISVQSWLIENLYIIEYTTKDTEILTEYVDRETWETILKGLVETNII